MVSQVHMRKEVHFDRLGVQHNLQVLKAVAPARLHDFTTCGPAFRLWNIPLSSQQGIPKSVNFSLSSLFYYRPNKRGSYFDFVD